MRKTYVIAEIGNTHEGSLGLAKQFVKSVMECGIDCVKFQTHIFDAESLANAPNPPYFKDESRKEYFDRTGFSLKDWQSLKNFTEKECHLDFISSPFSLEAVDLLEKIDVIAYKIPSGEVTNIPLLIKVAKTAKKIYLSSGMSNWQELDLAVETLQENGCKDLIVLQCTSEYPCPPEESGINVIAKLKEKYNLEVGYSDHSLGLAVPLAAVCAGATIIEKHFTLSKNMYGSDAKNSTEPDEFKRLVCEIRNIEKALNSNVDKDEKCAKLANMKTTFEKSIVSACDIRKGTIIEEKHLAYKKPGDGIPAREYLDLIGKKTIVDINVNEQLKYENMESV